MCHNNQVAPTAYSNNDLAIRLATIHHLATIALNPDTPPEIAEKAIIRIANDSELLTDHFIGDDKALQAKIWNGLVNDVEMEVLS